MTAPSIEANLPKLEAMIAAIMEPQYEPGGLELRAREIRRRYESPADGTVAAARAARYHMMGGLNAHNDLDTL